MHTIAHFCLQHTNIEHMSTTTSTITRTPPTGTVTARMRVDGGSPGNVGEPHMTQQLDERNVMPQKFPC